MARLRVVHASTCGFFGPSGPGSGYPYIGGSAETAPRAGFNDLRRAAEELLDDAIAVVRSRKSAVTGPEPTAAPGPRARVEQAS